jgi:LmbE family N-acetylglucosaminyl deacetylase
MNILVLSAHPDDAEVGCGGTIARFVEEGNDVLNLVFTANELASSGNKNVKMSEMNRAAAVLGIKSRYLPGFHHRTLNQDRQALLDSLVMFKSSYNPDMVFCPSENDMHQDHQVVAHEAIRAFKHCTLLGYEMLWNNITFNTRCFVKLKPQHVDQKLKALGCYESWRDKPYMKGTAITSLAKTRGLQGGCDLAETFEVMRLFY